MQAIMPNPDRAASAGRAGPRAGPCNGLWLGLRARDQPARGGGRVRDLREIERQRLRGPRVRDAAVAAGGEVADQGVLEREAHVGERLAGVVWLDEIDLNLGTLAP